MTEAKEKIGKQMETRGMQKFLAFFSPARNWPWKWLLAGLFIRLVLMPIAVHSDFIHTWWASACMVKGQTVPLQIQTLLFWLHTDYLRLVGALLPASADWCTQYYGFATDTASFTAWFAFLQQPQIFRTLWLLKLPYLFFDAGCAVLIFNLGATLKKSRWLMIFWWLNPVTIYAISIIGRHESIAIFFILLSLYLLRQKQCAWAFVALGIAIALRYYPAFLLPFFIFSLPGSLWRRLTWGMLGIGPWVLINISMALSTGRSELAPLLNYSYNSSMLSLRLNIADWDWIYLFPLSYFILLLHRLSNTQRDQTSLERYSLLVLLLLLSLTNAAQAPHYWIWFIPFLALYLVEERVYFWLHAAQIVFLLVIGWIGNRATAGYLFAPISLEFFWSLPGPVEVVRSFAPIELIISLSRTAFTAVSLWLAYSIIRQFPSVFPAKPGSRGEE